ncbi:MAG: hypothetical protein C4K60_20505 [Ideonella sp. MAG2]|nr:MAG: hypothetical protein C4K60_20505 [Ideonella sp. MAG2]
MNRQFMVVGRQRSPMRGHMLWLTGAMFSAATLAQSLPPPNLPHYALVEPDKKAYGRASYDFRDVGCIDYWFVGHDTTDGPFMCDLAQKGAFKSRTTRLPTKAVDGTDMDRHECGFMHLDGDRKIDMVCTLGANKGTGTGPNEVYRNTSTSTKVQMTRISTPTGIEDPYGRGRTVEPFRWADGTQGVWTTVHGALRLDGHPNINRLFRYNGLGSFTFTEVPEPLVNITTYNNCSRSGDLNGDGLDDLVLCRDVGEGGKHPAPSLVLYQNPDMSWRSATLPMASKYWLTAEVRDLNQDGRKDLLVSISEAGNYRIELYLQAADGSLPAQPSWSAALSAPANSLAVGDMDGDGHPDIYVTQSQTAVCQNQGKTKGKMTDTWPDVLFYSAGVSGGGWAPLVLSNEPQADGCSWLATAAEPGVIHLARGYEGYPGDNYVVFFGAAAAQAAKVTPTAPPTQAQRQRAWREAILEQIRDR